jgi:hypothetical protein
MPPKRSPSGDQVPSEGENSTLVGDGGDVSQPLADAAPAPAPDPAPDSAPAPEPQSAPTDGPPLDGGGPTVEPESAPSDGGATFRDDEYSVSQLLESSRMLLGEPEWLVRAALKAAELGDFVTIEQAQAAVTAFRARPVEG